MPKKVYKKKGGVGETCSTDPSSDDYGTCRDGEERCDGSKGVCVYAGGASKHKLHNGRSYVVRTGSRGGKYILVKGKKVYV